MHSTAATFESTDWAQIHELYRMLLTVAPSPAAELGAAIALSELDGPAAGLEALRPLASARPRDHRVLAAMAHLLDDLGSPDAADAYQRAAALTDSIPEQRYLNARAEQAREGRPGVTTSTGSRVAGPRRGDRGPAPGAAPGAPGPSRRGRPG